MSSWQEAYDTGAFSITTDEPSVLLAEFADEIPAPSTVADVGCGAGRNAIYLANKGFRVFATDIVDLGWYKDLTALQSLRISFGVLSTAQLELAENRYGAVVMSRLLQYLTPEELADLTAKTASALQVGGLAVVSYVVEGVSKQLDVPKYIHQPEAVVDAFSSLGVETVELRQFDTESSHVPAHFSSNLNVCEYVGKKV